MIKKRTKLVEIDQKQLKNDFYDQYFSQAKLLTPPKNLLTTIGAGLNVNMDMSHI